MDFSVADAIIFPALATSISPSHYFIRGAVSARGFSRVPVRMLWGVGKAWRWTGTVTNAATNAASKGPTL
jgi:hypothetical protein